MLEDVTAKQIYANWLNLEQEPAAVLEEMNKPWNAVWARVRSGMVEGEAFNSVFLLAHNRLGTRERGSRLMPDRYKSGMCLNCKAGVEDVAHRYTTCNWVVGLWKWMADTLMELDEGLRGRPTLEILRFQYPKGLREGAVTWLLARYISIVDREVMVKGRKLSVAELVGTLRFARSRLRHGAVEEIGVIPGLEGRNSRGN